MKEQFCELTDLNICSEYCKFALCALDTYAYHCALQL